jgi:glycosyltransferase involved in cell wall biosynthesis
MHIVKRGKMIISLTQGDAHFWRENGANRVIVLPNPLAIYPEKIDDVGKDPYRIIFVGRFEAVKRINLLISAFTLINEKFPRWHIDIFGDGKKEIIEQFVDDNLVGRIRIHKPTSDIFSEYKKSQMLVLCSSYEGFGLVLIEAMACGIPCVSFDCPYGPPEIIKDHYNGLLAKNGDVKDLADKMEWLITHTEERYAMGVNARQFAAKFKKEIVMKDWENAYNALIDENVV